MGKFGFGRWALFGKVPVLPMRWVPWAAYVDVRGGWYGAIEVVVQVGWIGCSGVYAR